LLSLVNKCSRGYAKGVPLRIPRTFPIVLSAASADARKWDRRSSPAKQIFSDRALDPIVLLTFPLWKSINKMSLLIHLLPEFQKLHTSKPSLPSIIHHEALYCHSPSFPPSQRPRNPHTRHKALHTGTKFPFLTSDSPFLRPDTHFLRLPLLHPKNNAITKNRKTASASMPAPGESSEHA
jgi:hypothetical protein